MKNNIIATHFVGALLFGLVMVMFVGTAKADHALHGKDVICATLAWNGGFNEQGRKYAARVDPFWDNQKVFITELSKATVDLIASRVDEYDGTLTAAARGYFNKKCEVL